MRLGSFVFVSTVAIASSAWAADQAPAHITCTAQVYEALSDGSVRQEKVPLKVELDNPMNIILTGDLDGRSFTLNGEKTGPFLVSITEGPDYTKGSITTAEFSASGRLQLSTVNKNLVHKIECFNK